MCIHGNSNDKTQVQSSSSHVRGLAECPYLFGWCSVLIKQKQQLIQDNVIIDSFLISVSQFVFCPPAPTTCALSVPMQPLLLIHSNLEWKLKIEPHLVYNTLSWAKITISTPPLSFHQMILILTRYSLKRGTILSFVTRAEPFRQKRHCT